jgi:hypothetical protein
MADPVKTIQELADHTASWDWENKHVAQAYISPNGIEEQGTVSINDIIESGTVLLAAGPSDLDVATDVTKNKDGFRIVPIGLIETVQVSMNKPLSRIFEIGSKLSYIIPGKTVGGIALNRVFFDGPSILKAMYFGEVKADYADETNKFAKFISNPYSEAGQEAYQKFAHIGSGNLAMNLASSFFDQPVGLAMYFKDQQNDAVGQIYFEGCRVSTYNIGISANMNVITESINMEFIRIRPIVTKATSVAIPKVDYADLNIVSASDNAG